MIKAIETEYRGHRFRSRTEARWAVFFDAAGLKFDYEREGVELDGRRYLPDFWLSTAQIWLEVKGVDPTQQERSLCKQLADQSGSPCLLAVGPPSRDNPVYLYKPNAHEEDWFGRGECGFHFDDSRDQPGEIYLTALDQTNWLKLIKSSPAHRPIYKAYEASNSARFEFGQSGAAPAKQTYADLQRSSRHLWGMQPSPALRAKIGQWRDTK